MKPELSFVSFDVIVQVPEKHKGASREAPKVRSSSLPSHKRHQHGSWVTSAHPERGLRAHQEARGLRSAVIKLACGDPGTVVVPPDSCRSISHAWEHDYPLAAPIRFIQPSGGLSGSSEAP